MGIRSVGKTFNELTLIQCSCFSRNCCFIHYLVWCIVGSNWRRWILVFVASEQCYDIKKTVFGELLLVIVNWGYIRFSTMRIQNVKCHSKSATDFGFINHSSSLLATCGHSNGESNVCLWDTLLPHDKSIVQGEYFLAQFPYVLIGNFHKFAFSVRLPSRRGSMSSLCAWTRISLHWGKVWGDLHIRHSPATDAQIF